MIALATNPLDDDKKPRARVNAWLRGESTVSASRAFEVGEVLCDKLKLRDASGPAALYAAGYFGVLVRLFESLVFLGEQEYSRRTRIPIGATREQMFSKHAVARSYWEDGSDYERIAVRLYCLLPTAFHQIDFGPTLLPRVIYPPCTTITGRFESDIATSARQKLSMDKYERQICQEGWDNIGPHCRASRNLDSTFDAAYTVLSVAFPDPAEGARIAWSILRHRLRVAARPAFKSYESYLDAYDKYVQRRLEGVSYEIPVDRTGSLPGQARRTSVERQERL
jgi:hypothetical protein